MTAARGLDLDDDPEFQKREWRGRRVGMVLLVGFVLAAALGLTGAGGPLSHGEASAAGGALRVEYERFVRRGATATLRLHVRATPGHVRVWVAGPYLAQVRVESVAPEPELVSADAARHTYEIRTASPEVTVTLVVEHESVGQLQADVGLVDGPSVRFSQLAFF